MENNYCVYVHINKYNNKVYVGITSRKPQVRWQSGQGYKNNKHFYSAIQKYGWDSFQHEILYKFLTKEQACQKEKELIAYYNSNNSNYGYNQTIGGEGVTGAGGWKHTEETKLKMSLGHKGKKVYCIELDKEFDNIGIAARETGANRQTISRCCNGTRKTSGGYHWEFVD